MKFLFKSPPLTKLTAFLLLAAVALPAGAQTVTKIREGHAVNIRNQAPPTLTSATQKCGAGETDQCFTIWPSAELIDKIRFFQLAAVTDTCKNEAGIRVTVGGTTYELVDDDHFAPRTCNGTMTKYDSGWRDGSPGSCRAHEIFRGAESGCLAKCLSTQIYREAGWVNPVTGIATTREACETWR